MIFKLRLPCVDAVGWAPPIPLLNNKSLPPSSLLFRYTCVIVIDSTVFRRYWTFGRISKDQNSCQPNSIDQVADTMMLDVVATREEPTMERTSTPQNHNNSSNSGKPYLKFGVSVILGLEPDQHRSPERITLVKAEDLSPPVAVSSQHHFHHQSNGSHQFHPAYLHSYFHPLIQQQQQQHHHHLPTAKNFASKCLIFLF